MPPTRKYKGHVMVKIDGLWEIRRNSRFNFTWAWAENINHAKELVDSL